MSALPSVVAGDLRAAAEWRLLALLFSRPRPGWLEEVEALAGEVGPLLREAAAAASGAGEGAYHALLGAGGVASPREAAHAGWQDPGRILADLAARYQAFGFAPRIEEPDDHLAVECSFVAYLHLKAAYAEAGQVAEAVELTRQARDAFLQEHLALAGHGMARTLPEGAPAYLGLAARALAERLPAPPPAAEGHCHAGEELEEGCPQLGRA